MNKSRYQIIPITQGVTATAVFNEVEAVLDTTYQKVTGIAVVMYAGIGRNIRLGFETNQTIVFRDSPLNNWDLATSTVRDVTKDMFRKIIFPAAGNSFRVRFSCDSISTALKADVILRLENLDGASESAFSDIGTYDFQHKQFTLPLGTTGKYDFTQFNVTSGFKKIAGIWMQGFTASRFAIKNPGGEYVLHQLPAPLLIPTKNLAYSQRFQPWDYPANGAQIKCEIEPLDTVSSDTPIDVVLLLHKK